MKCNITCSCGHERIVQIYGTQQQRERKIRYYESNECDSCRIESLKQQAKEKKLPELTGSEKQINWALSLREKHLDILKQSYYNSKSNPQYLILIEFVAKQIKAKTFIDAENSGRSITKYYVELYKQAN